MNNIKDIKVVEPNEKMLAMTEKVIELNKMVLQQNEMIIKALANPQLVLNRFKPEEK